MTGDDATPMALVMSDVSYRYAGAAGPALRGVSLVVERGRVLGVVGANGAGKSTLCLAAVGLAPLTIGGSLDGVVTVDGLSTSEARQHELAVRAGILFQEPEAQLSGSAASVWEEVAFGPRNLGLPLDEVLERTWSAIDDLHIGELIERNPSRLSGGQAQLVALAAVLALRPALLVLDEPTSQLDPEGAALVVEALERATQRTGAAVLIVEHRSDLLERVCDDLVVLVDGAVAARGSAAELLADPDVAELGVMPPSSARLRRALEEAGLRWQPESEWAR